MGSIFPSAIFFLAEEFPLVTKSEELTEESFALLRVAENYREFIRIYLSIFNYSLADFARASGFGRGFPSEVISGKRRLTAKSGHAFERALKLPIPAKKLFRLLVVLEESDFYPDMDRDNLPQEIARLRRHPWKRVRTEKPESALGLKHKVLDKKAQIIYAAAGDFLKGATFKEIKARTGLSDKEILHKTIELESHGLIEINDSINVVPKELHLFLKTCNQSELLIESFKESAELAVQHVTSLKKDSSEFFFSSSFCIDEEKMPKLKQELRETILKYIDNSIDSSGDRVANLILALHL